MKRILKSTILEFWPIITAAFIFLLLTYQYWGEVPALDQLVIYRESIILYTEGFQGLVATGNPVHPPLLYWLYQVGFFLFGKGSASVNVVGFMVYLCTVLAMNRISRRFFDQPWSGVVTLLFAITPLLVLHSFYLSNDVLILCAFAWAIDRYQQKDRRTLSLVLATTTLMKETALVITISLILWSLYGLFRITAEKRVPKLVNAVLIIFPAVCTYLAWKYFLKHIGATEWRETSFGVTESNSFLVVIHTFLEGKIFSRFLLGNLYNTFVMNFHWIITETAIAGGILFLTRNGVMQKKGRELLMVITITAGYIFTVFTFPTWTLARYGIPTFLALYLLVGVFLTRIARPYALFVSTLLFGVLIVSNVSSVDALTAGKLPPLTVAHIDFYSTNVGYNGYTMVDYNMQYAAALKKQNAGIRDFFSSQKQYYVTTCSELKVGEKIWTMQLAPAYYPGYTRTEQTKHCVNWWEVTEDGDQ